MNSQAGSQVSDGALRRDGSNTASLLHSVKVATSALHGVGQQFVKEI